MSVCAHKFTLIQIPLYWVSIKCIDTDFWSEPAERSTHEFLIEKEGLRMRRSKISEKQFTQAWMSVTIASKNNKNWT